MSDALEGAFVHDDILNQVRIVFDNLEDDIPAGRLSVESKAKLIDGLPRIEEKELVELREKDSSCPICFTPYLAILAEEEMASAMDSPAHPVEHLGVTKLSQSWQCGHMFCRRDISTWISGGHDSCPLCRRLLVEAREPRTVADQAALEAEGLAEVEDARAAIRALSDRLFGPGGIASGGGVFGNFHPDPPRNGNDDHDSRRDFSGMYS